MRWPLLEGIPEGDVRQLLSIARRRRFVRGEVVFHEHDPADTLHLIERGRFAVRVSTPVGDSAILAILGPGDMFGELALIEAGAARSATVMALERAETYCVHSIDFGRLRERHPSVEGIITAILAGQVRRLSRHLLEALYVPADKRVLRRLVEIAAIYGNGVADSEIELPLTQDDLAGLAGTSRATVNRVLRDQEDRGLLRLGRGRTTLLDIDALAARGR